MVIICEGCDGKHECPRGIDGTTDLPVGWQRVDTEVKLTPGIPDREKEFQNCTVANPMKLHLCPKCRVTGVEQLSAVMIAVFRTAIRDHRPTMDESFVDGAAMDRRPKA